MNIKPFSNFQAILRLIFVFGITLDTYSVYRSWMELNDNEQIASTFLKYGTSAEELGIEPLLEVFQGVMSLTLLFFLIFSYIAYYYFLKRRNWARKYVLSITIFYLVSCVFSFSLAPFIFSTVTIYYLFGARQFFSPIKQP